MKFPGLVQILLMWLLLIVYADGLAQPQPGSNFKLFLIGDAGEGDTTGATLLDLKIQLEENPNSAVIFLGDNCYSKFFYGIVNLQTGGFDEGKLGRRRVMSQLNILRNYEGSVYFVPGNHDWWNSLKLEKAKRWLLAEEKFIEDTVRKFSGVQNHNENICLPVNGLPGPVSREFNDSKIKVIFIDTYRMIIEESKRVRKDTMLLKRFYNEFKTQLVEGKNRNQKIIIAGHHPVHSKGKHSGTYGFWERQMGRFATSNTDYMPYRNFAHHLDSLMKEVSSGDVYYTSGHEHSLEYFYKDSMHYIVSGAGSRIDKVKKKSTKNTDEYLLWNEEGYVEIEFKETHEKILMHHRQQTGPMNVTCISGCN